MPKPVIAVTGGDPGGIGPEIIAKTFRVLSKNPRCHYLLIGTRAPFEFLQKKFGLKVRLNFLKEFDSARLRDDAVNFLEIGTEIASPRYLGTRVRNDVPRGAAKNTVIARRPEADEAISHFDIGKISKQNALIAYRALEVAAQLAKQKKIQAMVTAPINKSSMRLVDKGFHGHTEFLADRAGAKHFAMMFVSERLKVTLVTIHVSLKKVSSLLKPEMIHEKILLTDRFLKKYFKIKSPRLGVCALNPHGRECGREEDRIIVPAIQKARRSGIHAEGPLAGDQVFFDAYHGKYDAVISMYHDQGLAPFKLIAFRDGVNVTLGLPYIRTSPDHGTAFDIACQDKADPVSFKSALRLAEKLVL